MSIRLNGLHRTTLSAWLAISCIAVSMLGLTACSQSSASKAKTVAKTEEAEVAPQVPAIPVVKVERRQLEQAMSLPGELDAYQNVPIHAKVEGFISWIGVDRGYKVKKGQKLIVISCPELNEKLKEAGAKVSEANATYRQSQSALQSEKSKQVEAQAKLDADQLTYSRLLQAAKTPGAIAQNEVDMAAKTAESDAARVQSTKDSIKAAIAVVQSQQQNVEAQRRVVESLHDMMDYLTVTAPFDGVITERNVHEGSMVGVSAEPHGGGSTAPSYPTEVVAKISGCCARKLCVRLAGRRKDPFHRSGISRKNFHRNDRQAWVCLRYPNAHDAGRLDVQNEKGELEPGMFAYVNWTVSRPYKTLFIPSSAVASDLQGTFVVRIKDGISKRIPVSKGQTMGNRTEVEGALSDGDEVALKATDELKTGTHLVAKLANNDDISNASANKPTSSGE